MINHCQTGAKRHPVYIDNGADRMSVFNQVIRGRTSGCSTLLSLPIMNRFLRSLQCVKVINDCHIPQLYLVKLWNVKFHLVGLQLFD